MITDPFHAYVNSRPKVDWNTCGAAAIATITDFHGLDPMHLPRVRLSADGRGHWDDGQAIDAVIAAGFGPDVVLRLGTSGGRIRNALRSFGLDARVGYSGAFGIGWRDQWRTLQSHLAADLPVPVLLDLGALGGRRFTAHWAIAYRVDSTGVHLGNCPYPALSVPAFLRAWACWYLPLHFNHCAVYSRGPAEPG